MTVVGFTDFKLLKLLVLLVKSASCLFPCCELFISLNRKTLNLFVSVKRNK